MKARIMSITAGLSSLLFSGCDYMTHKPVDCITVVVDKSDSMVLASEITASDIVNYLRVDSLTDYAYGAHVRLTMVSSLRGNREFKTELKAESPAQSNYRQRARLIGQMMAKVQDDLQKIQSEANGTSHSRIFYTLFENLNRLSQSECSQRTLLFLSDLQQHSPDEFSVVRSSDWSRLISHPEEIASYLDNTYPLNSEDIKGIRVVFAYRPTKMVDDERYYVMEKFLASYLTEKGIIVETWTSFN